jgi:Domain of unknown function (DUF4292)
MLNHGTDAGPITKENFSMHKYLVIIGLIGVFLVGMTGCRSTKTIRKAIAAPAVHADTTGDAAREAALPARDAHADSLEVIHKALAGIKANHIDFQSFSGHMHVHFQSEDGKDYEVNAVVHIVKDQRIWLSVFGSVGPVTIEVFRMLITPDSVKILDKMKHIVRLRSVSYLQEQVHLPVDFRAVQDILMGNPVYLDTSKILYYRKETKGLTLYTIGMVFSNFLTLNPDYTPHHSKLDDTDPMQARTCDLTYGDYDNSGPVPFSTYRKVSVQEKGKVDIEIVIKQFKFNEALSDNFSIPKNYKRR